MKNFLVRLFCLFLAFGGACAFSATENKPAVSSEVSAIDMQLQKLYKERDSLRWRRDNCNRESERLMFLDFLGAKIYSQKADSFQAKLQVVEEQIATLEAQKQKCMGGK